MREIKFRAWFPNGKINPLHNWKFDNVPVMEEVDLNEQHCDTTEFYIAQRDGILMQDTGLKDINNKSIFEGDIVCYVEDVVVEVIGGYPRTEPEGIFLEVKIPEFYHFTHEMVGVEEMEVVGNIYENKDLLNE